MGSREVMSTGRSEGLKGMPYAVFYVVKCYKYCIYTKTGTNVFSNADLFCPCYKKKQS